MNSTTPNVICIVTPPPPLYKLRPCPSYSRRGDHINLVPNFNSVPNVVQPHKTWVSRICQSHRVMDTFVVSVCPLEPTPFLSPLLQVMILVTPMMLLVNLFGLRLPEVCGGMAHVFDGKLCFTRDHLQGNFIPKNLKLPQPNPAPTPRAKASSSGEHVRLFCIVYDRKKGFQVEHL